MGGREGQAQAVDVERATKKPLALVFIPGTSVSQRESTREPL